MTRANQMWMKGARQQGQANMGCEKLAKQRSVFVFVSISSKLHQIEVATAEHHLILVLQEAQSRNRQAASAAGH